MVLFLIAANANNENFPLLYFDNLQEKKTLALTHSFFICIIYDIFKYRNKNNL